MGCAFGSDGRKWIAPQKLAVDFPDKLKLGISTANTSKKAFAAKFEEFGVIKPEVKVAAAEGE